MSDAFVVICCRVTVDGNALATIAKMIESFRRVVSDLIISLARNGANRSNIDDTVNSKKSSSMTLRPRIVPF